MTNTKDVSNETTVLFVLALVYSCFMILMYFRTWSYMARFSTQELPLTFNDKIFKVFYGLVWFNVTISCLLYWIISMERLNDKDPLADSTRFSFIGYLPSIL
jgi:hypothetical protein